MATLAIFLYGFPHAVLVAGYIVMIIASFFPDDVWQDYDVPISATASIGSVIALWVAANVTGLIGYWVASAATVAMAALWVWQWNKRKPAVPKQELPAVAPPPAVP